MVSQITIRPTTVRDLPRIDALLSESYPALLKPDYPPSVLVTALPLIARANPSLLRSGTYFVAEDGEGRALAAGGWTMVGTAGRRGPARSGPYPPRGHASLPRVRGLGRGDPRALLFREARAAGLTWMMAQSTRTAVPFYRAMGFEERAEIEVLLRPGIGFPAVEMARGL
jgi:hypothetical protein